MLNINNLTMTINRRFLGRKKHWSNFTTYIHSFNPLCCKGKQLISKNTHHCLGFIKRCLGFNKRHHGFNKR